MWFQAEVIFPRILKSFFLALVLQEIYIVSFLLVFKIISWNPFNGFIEWLFYLIHWKSLLYQGILCLTTVLFGALNTRYFSVQKHISSTRFQKICRALSPSFLQHFVATAILGSITSYCCIGLFHSFDPNKTSLLGNCLQLKSEFEHFFVIQHGCYIGIMFSLKYFICCLYLLKFSLDQKTKIQCLKSNAYDLLKDSVSCVLKAMFWYYLAYFIMGPFLQNFVITPSRPPSSTMENTMYSMLSPTLFFVTFISGVIIFCNWNIYILIFNMCAVERYIFKTEMPTKNENNKCLSVALQASHSDMLKYLAVLDLRLLSQYDTKRRLQIFAISHPGGHPYQWKSISDVCITSLKDLSEKLHAYSVAIVARGTKVEIQSFASTLGMKPKATASEKVLQYFRKWPTVCYFFDELPNSKIRQIFSSSQPLTWMSEALGFLLSAAYVEDKYGVVQQMLPEIVCLLLDLKMVEEKLPIDPIGIKTHVRDPQDRYEHIHQRLALKTAVNGSLCRIAAAFKDDIKGIYLPDEYNRYFQRFISQKNA